MTAWTEEEAKTKWCPFAPTQFEEVTTDCIASRCMAWRLGSSMWKDNLGKTYETKGDAFGRGDRQYTEIKRGFCGLAGRPE